MVASIDCQIEVSIISKNYRRSSTLRASRFSQSAAVPILLGVLFFFVLCLGAPDSIKGMAMIVAIAALLVTAVRFGVLRERIRWPFVALTLYVLMDGISTFYAVSGKFALKEFLKVFLAYGMAVILLTTSPKNEETTGKHIATILAVCATIGSLVSIDLISTRWISGAVTWALGLFTDSYQNLTGITPGTRIDSFFSNSNVFAGLSGLGVLLSLGLADAAKDKKERCFFLCMLYMNTLAFLLALSLGAIFFLVIAFLVFLLTQRKEKRASLFTLMVELVIMAAAAVVVISKTSFQAWTGVRLIPLLCVIVEAAVLCCLDIFVGQKLASKVHVSRKAVTVLIIACIVLIAVFTYAALTLTGDAVLAPGETLMRTAYPAPGEYSLNVQTDGGALNVRIRSRSIIQATMQRDTILYNGSADAASFVVPDDSAVVFFDFSTEEGAHLLEADYSGNKIPLRYKLLPSNVAYRLQGIRASHSTLLRTVYFQDGIKLFRRSPIVGLGMGAFENAIKSVQSFYYETKYAHNHYFQTMLETGIIGLLLFLGLLATSAIAVWKSRKEHPFAPMLGAALVFMAGQAMHDIVFSAYAYLPIAYGTFAMIGLCCGEAIRKPKLTRIGKTIGIAVTALCTIIYCGFLAGNMLAAKKIQETPTLDTLVEGTRLDRFEWADYALPYVINVTGVEDLTSDVISQADSFARRLSKVNSNTIPIYLAQYYFASNRTELGVKMVEKYVDYLASDQKAWNMAFALLQTYADDSEAFRSGVIRIAQKLEAWNAENVGDIELNKGAKTFAASYTGE